MNGGGLEPSGSVRGPTVSSITNAVVPGRRGESSRSMPVLENLVLPAPCLALLRVPLERAGYLAEEAERSRLEGGTKSTVRYTLVAKADQKSPLLYIQNDIVTIYTPGNRAALDELRVLFEDEFRTLYILHDAEPHGVYHNLAGSWESRYGIRVRFLPVQCIRDFEGMDLDEQVAYLRRELELEGPAAVARAPPPKAAGADLSTRHVNKLIAVLGDVSQFDTASHRETFLSAAGLRDLVADLQFEGPRQVVAGAVVLAVIRREGKGFAALIPALRDQSDLPADSKAFLVSLLTQYEFT